MTLVVDLERISLATRLHTRLVAEARPEGGWGYYPGKSSRVEPTCWTLLALEATWPGDRSAWLAFVAPHLGFLARCQRTDGLLTEQAQAPNNFAADGIATLTLSHLGVEGGPDLSRLVGGIVAAKGVKLANSSDNTQDNTLQGWSWMPDTFSWLEPTAWCLLALKKVKHVRARGAADRIDVAERLIVNRSCKTGGWNFGNSSALGQDLRAYVPTTALGLVAMQDRTADPSVAHALQFLERAQLSEPSGMALALASICLRIFGRPSGEADRLLATWAGRTERRTNLHTLAMSLYALTGEQHLVKALRV